MTHAVPISSRVSAVLVHAFVCGRQRKGWRKNCAGVHSQGWAEVNFAGWLAWVASQTSSTIATMSWWRTS